MASQTSNPPVLLIHGDDDRNVPFQQTTDLVVTKGEPRKIEYANRIRPFAPQKAIFLEDKLPWVSSTSRFRPS
jgi:fermentation-respiration switch protein FrsA (DUF1100 family)